MKKLYGKRINTAIFISGRGTNLKNLIKYSKKSPTIKIIYVISNNYSAKGIFFAKKNKIKTKIIDFSKKKEIFSLLKLLNKKKIKLICLAGFMKILSKDFIKLFNGKIINIHPSLLPKYKGLNTHKRVIQNREKFTGCTVHFVTSKLDSGRIIMQKKIQIYKNDTSKTLEKRVLKSEYKLYPASIEKIRFNL